MLTHYILDLTADVFFILFHNNLYLVWYVHACVLVYSSIYKVLVFGGPSVRSILCHHSIHVIRTYADLPFLFCPRYTICFSYGVYYFFFFFFFFSSC